MTQIVKGPNDNIPGGPEAPRSTASSLLIRVKAGEPDSGRRLVHLYGPLVYRWCRLGGTPPDDAPDVVQEVFLAVASGIGGFRRDQPGDTFRGWLRGITRHKLADYWRRRQQQPRAAGGSDAQHQLAQVPVAEEDAGCEDVGGLFHRALELIGTEFEERTWQAFLRVTVEGQATADVARDLQLTINAVYIAKSRILRRLREELGDALP